MNETLDRATASPSPSAPSAESTLTLGWLGDAARTTTNDESATLLGHLIHLRGSSIDFRQRAEALARIHDRSAMLVGRLVPTLADLKLPVPRKQRQVIRTLQELLLTLADDLKSLGAPVPVMSGDAAERAAVLWRCMHALSASLLISDLIAAPSQPDVWRRLHSTFQCIRAQRLDAERVADNSQTPGELYIAAVLRACAQPASFTPRECAFVASYLSQHAYLARWFSEPGEATRASFWIDPDRDSPATPCARQAPPNDIRAEFIDCERLAVTIREQLSAMRSGATPSRLGLDEFAGTPAGRGALRRVAESLGNPVKRRFPRRRQHYRAALCAGLDDLWRLFRHGADAKIEASSWMITNESPDGYSIMHVLGNSARVTVGDLVAIRPESGDKWQVCIARWVRSENQEHLEFGLQILATKAVPATLTTTSGRNTPSSGPIQRPVLLLPQIPPLRPDDMLVAPSGLLDGQPHDLVLVIEEGNIEIREARSGQLNEQNGLIEVFSIEPVTDAT